MPQTNPLTFFLSFLFILPPFSLLLFPFLSLTDLGVDNNYSGSNKCHHHCHCFWLVSKNKGVGCGCSSFYCHFFIIGAISVAVVVATIKTITITKWKWRGKGVVEVKTSSLSLLCVENFGTFLNLGGLVHLGGLNGSRAHRNKKRNPIWTSFFIFQNFQKCQI